MVLIDHGFSKYSLSFNHHEKSTRLLLAISSDLNGIFLCFLRMGGKKGTKNLNR